MPTRFKTQSRKNYGIAPLQSGYEKSSGTPDFYINSCGLEDVDVSLFELFDKEISPQVGKDETNLIKVPVIFAAGEKWAMIKKGRPVRDQTGSLILPLITITRSEIIQDLSSDIAGRGINQQQGELIIRRRLDKSDRDYQNLVNRLLVTNQRSLALSPSGSLVDKQITTERKLGDLTVDKDIIDGAYLKPNMLNNIFETITVPAPQFYTVKYQVTVWTQYMQHTNQVTEKIISSFLPQSQSWRLDTQKGYWFIASIEPGSFSTETSFDDMSTSERFIKHSFTVVVPAYFFATQAPGSPVPLKRYVSYPAIKFDNQSLDNDNVSTDLSVENKYILGSDDPTLPLDNKQNFLEDQRNTGWTQQKIYPVVQSRNSEDLTKEDQNDPAFTTAPRGNIFIKTVNTNVKGETVYSGYSLGGLEISFTNDK